MQIQNNQRDVSSLIMRNPYESISGSKESSKFYQPENPYIQVRQFDGNHETERQKKFEHQKNQQNDSRQMKNMYSFYNQNLIVKDTSPQDSTKQNLNKQISRNQIQKQINPEFNYSQRLTFQNQSVSPFIRIQNPVKNPLSSEEIELRQSFNPLQSRVHELQKMCKKLYEISLKQMNEFEIQRNSILRIQQKVDYLLEFYQNLQQKKQSKFTTREGNDNRKRSSIPYKSIDGKNVPEIDFLNSSEKLSRYLEPPSSEEANLRKFEERSIYNNSRDTQSSKTRKIKPFLARSDIQNECSIPELYPYNIVEFDEKEKENVDSSNFICQRSKEFNPIKKKNYSQKHESSDRHKKSTQKIIMERKSSEKTHQHSAKLHKKMTQQLRKLPNNLNQAENYKSAQVNQKAKKNQKVLVKQRAKSEHTTNRKNTHIYNNKKKTYNEVSVTAPNTDYEERERSKTNNMSKLHEGNMLQTSAIFKAVEFSSIEYPNRPIQIKQSLSSELERHKKRHLIQNHNKTLLESIEQKKQLIDRQLSKRLMKNAALLHGGSTNMLLSKEKYS